MTKVYIEHDDRHNEPILMTFESQSKAMEYVMRYVMDGDREEAEIELFDGEAGCGEYDTGSDKFIVITEDHARERSDYWDSVAEAIRFDKDAPP